MFSIPLRISEVSIFSSFEIVDVIVIVPRLKISPESVHFSRRPKINGQSNHGTKMGGFESKLLTVESHEAKRTYPDNVTTHHKTLIFFLAVFSRIIDYLALRVLFIHV